MKITSGLFIVLVTCLAVKANAQSDSFKIFSNYDFVPGEKVIFFDDFSADNIGDFPVQWTTNGSGEVVTTSLLPGKWFKVTSNRSVVTLAEPLTLPENYTIEFDVIPQKDVAGNNATGFNFYLISTPKPKDILYGLARPGGTGIRFEFGYNNYYYTYYADNAPALSGNVSQPKLKADNKYHIAVTVQKERIRLYIDENKVFDLAKAVSKNFKYNMIRFAGGVQMIGNVRVAAGLPDTRNKLLTEGKLVSYGIYFDVNADRLKPQSYGTLKEIAAVMTDNPMLKVKIVGHTDADGDDAFNLDLSKRRARSVKQALADFFGIDAVRLETDGKGEKEAVAPNDSAANKAKNRRVEFLKL